MIENKSLKRKWMEDVKKHKNQQKTEFKENVEVKESEKKSKEGK